MPPFAVGERGREGGTEGREEGRMREKSSRSKATIVSWSSKLLVLFGGGK
jgi:hypothetical protein